MTDDGADPDLPVPMPQPAENEGWVLALEISWLHLVGSRCADCDMQLLPRLLLQLGAQRAAAPRALPHALPLALLHAVAHLGVGGRAAGVAAGRAAAAEAAGHAHRGAGPGGPGTHLPAAAAARAAGGWHLRRTCTAALQTPTEGLSALYPNSWHFSYSVQKPPVFSKLGHFVAQMTVAPPAH